MGIEAYPETYDELLEACTTARDGGKTFTVLAGAHPVQHGPVLHARLGDPRLPGRPRLERAARSGRRDLRRQRAGRTSSKTSSTLNDSGCFQDGVEGGTFDTITQNVGGGTSLTAAVPGIRGDLDRQGTGLDLTVQAFPPADGQEPFTLASANYAWAINASSDDAVKASAQAFLDWARRARAGSGVRRPLRLRADHGSDAATTSTPSTSRSATCWRPARSLACPTRPGRTRPSTTPSASASRAC